MIADMKNVRIQTWEIGEGQPLAFIAGPCVIESRELVWKTSPPASGHPLSVNGEGRGPSRRLGAG